MAHPAIPPQTAPSPSAGAVDLRIVSEKLAARKKDRGLRGPFLHIINTAD